MLRSILLAIAFITIGADLYSQRVLPVGEGTVGQGSVYDMVEYNGQVILGGLFASFNGHARKNLQGWDGANHFDYPGAFEAPTNRVSALEIYNGDLIAGGNEPILGNIARWDGSTWHPMGAGINGTVKAIHIFNNELYAAGSDGTVNTWDGSVWQQLGDAFNGSIEAIQGHNGELYVGGDFDQNASSTVVIRRLAKWNGSSWVEVNNGLNNRVQNMLSTSDGLIIVGYFDSRGDGVQNFPSWTIFNGSNFNEPTFTVRNNLIGIESVCAHPQGGFILGGYGPYSMWVNGSETLDIRFNWLRNIIQYNGKLFVCGSSGTSYNVIRGLGHLVEGTEYALLDAGSNSAAITPTSSMFHDIYRSLPGFEAPKGDNTFTISLTSPWLIGKNMDTLHSSVPIYNVNDPPSAGPNANVMNSDYYERYYQVWKLDRDMISHHALHWNDAGYTAPYVISPWPGNGEEQWGTCTIAPYADLNSNGLYEPSTGEFPLIRGDQAIYYIQHTVQESWNQHPTMKLDLNIMSYAFNDPIETDLYSTVFCNFNIVNRGSDNYTDARFGIFADLDIGYSEDDVVECDSALNLFFAYNRYDIDLGASFTDAYGSFLPAQGVQFLNEPMTAHSSYRSGPLNVEDLMSGTFNGAPYMNLEYPTHFQFPGGAWTDTVNSVPTSTLNRMTIGSIGPFTYNSGDTICVDVAYPYAMSASGNRLESVTDLKARAQALRAWYATQDFACGYYPDNITQVATLDASTFALYPNPTSGEVTLTGYPAKESLAITVHNVLGAVVQQQTWPAAKPQFTLSTDGWNDGIYILSIAGKDRTTALRLVVSH
ncbi:MAG: T9SS type A sorting domain-containing protein [Flavobacteriales bacterium]|nr:T9SS type A sorting domain-containing protein [Flavobacteriales bacterium]